MTARMTGAALVAALTLGAAAVPAAAQEPADPPHTITVSGRASAVVPNDIARFTFGVQTRRATAAAAVRANSARIRRVISRVGAAGVAGADIVTSTISVTRTSRPVRPGSTRRIVEYVAINSVRVTVRQVREAGRVLDAAVNGGATSVRGPAFSPSDASQVYRRTLVDAFKDARDKAQQLAGQAGVTLGAPRSIHEGPAPDEIATPQPLVPPSAFERRRAPVTPVRPGKTRIQARVTVVFAIS